MIELPETLTIAKQISTGLASKRIAPATRGDSSRKFAFYRGSPEEHATILQGRDAGQGNDPQSFAISRHIALNLLRHEKTATCGTKTKHLRASWSEDYLLSVLNSLGQD